MISHDDILNLGRPVLTGPLVRLRPLVAGGAEAMYASRDDPEGMRLTRSACCQPAQVGYRVVWLSGDRRLVCGYSGFRALQ